jgi:hypothetical protein
MQFKYPEVLFFLFLLLIPLLIHLFQLQKFKKEAFTNVQFLKEIELETRKSSKLKKLLILLTRLLAFAALIIAFAQPYIDKNKSLDKRESIYYLDNSLSMQVKAAASIDQLQFNKNELLDKAASFKTDQTLLSNKILHDQLDSKTFKTRVVNLDYYPIHKNINQILLEINSDIKKKKNTLFDIYLLSDFQYINGVIDSSLIDRKQQYNLITPANSDQKNISIDSIWIAERNSKDITLISSLTSHGLDVDDLSVSLNLNEVLYGKSTLNLTAGTSKEIAFKIPATDSSSGKISISDHALNFDNELFFNIPKNYKTKVLIIGHKSDFLDRIYQKDAFELTKVSYKNLDQSQITKQDLIILDELETISNPLIQTLNSFVQNKGKLVIIPAITGELLTYNKLLQSFDAGSISDKFNTDKKISRINYEHPFFNNVFEEEIYNFQYPTLTEGFTMLLKNASPLLQFDDRTDFASEIKYKEGKVYVIAAPLSGQRNKFSSSPLVVPLFYNFSLEGQQNEAIYKTIGQTNHMVIQSNSSGDQPLKIVRNELEFIPLQSKNNDKIRVTTNDYPLTAGIYEFKSNDQVIEKIAYNYNRKESDLSYQPLRPLADQYDNIYLYESIDKAIKDGNQRNNNKNLWQLFIIFALVFLVLEILLQKFLKN